VYRLIGYETQSIKISIQDKDVSLDIDMKPVVIQSPEIVVTGSFVGSQHENVMKVHTLQPKEIETGSSTGLLQSLNRMSGIALISKGPGILTPVIHGLSTSNILLLQDGIPKENYQFSQNHPFMLDEYGNQQIEIIKGPASLLYGSGGVGGVINIISELPAQNHSIEGDLGIKYLGNPEGISGSLGVKGAGKNWFWGIRAGQHAFADYRDGKGNFVPNSRFQKRNFRLNIGKRTKNSLFSIRFHQNDYQLGLIIKPALKITHPGGSKMSLWFQRLRDQIASFENKLFFKKIKIESGFTYQRNHRQLFGNDTEDKKVEMLMNTFNYKAKANITWIENLKWVTGIQGKYQQNENMDAPVQVIPNATIRDFSLFSMGQYDFGNILLEAGIRNDYRFLFVPSTPSGEINLSRKYQNLSYSAGLLGDIAENVQLRLNFASAFRSPNLAELTQNGVHGNRFERGNVDLKIQQNTELNIDLHIHTRHLGLDWLVYYNYIPTYIHLEYTHDTSDNGLPVYQYQQMKAQIYGMDFSFHLHPHPFDWIHLKSTLSVIQGRKENDGYLSFIPANKLQSEVKFSSNNWKPFQHIFLKLEHDYVFSKNDVSKFEVEASAYHLFNIKLGGEIKIRKQRLVLSIFAANIFDVRYLSHLSSIRGLGYYDTGRNAGFAIKIPFSYKLHHR
jgi:iron complex outermembrane receptor protein